MPDPAPLLDIQIASIAWRRLPRLKQKLAQAVHTAHRHLPKKVRFPVSATLLLTTDAKIRRLNHDFRGIDKATNVLSFPQYAPGTWPKQGKNHPYIELGDIAIAYAICAKEARQNNVLLINHIIHLATHGFLHLFGYDHMSDGAAADMEKLETKIMRSLGLPDPYETNTRNA